MDHSLAGHEGTQRGDDLGLAGGGDARIAPQRQGDGDVRHTDLSRDVTQRNPGEFGSGVRHRQKIRPQAADY